mmetsp:Transcript_66253/g.184496  ORF Transcript_66253/g.184496 Transcript_66253/m.184496 type:complete len:586 (+) Transcript_66253:135-1892(+)|eukprot:CAMPEP_0117481080 /NCGR_PEP_ID=MMETSP0784-20121206/12719_1 /TAXON_ID=39447 /ORGANISM="" /LENGTH=585 /DNA_ID=CAMNT_0005275533 /DNA_START=54 /DNA_END=1811 /DNA_ORIENTATION=-
MAAQDALKFRITKVFDKGRLKLTVLRGQSDPETVVCGRLLDRFTKTALCAKALECEPEELQSRYPQVYEAIAELHRSDLPPGVQETEPLIDQLQKKYVEVFGDKPVGRNARSAASLREKLQISDEALLAMAEAAVAGNDVAIRAGSAKLQGKRSRSELLVAELQSMYVERFGDKPQGRSARNVAWLQDKLDMSDGDLEALVPAGASASPRSPANASAPEAAPATPKSQPSPQKAMLATEQSSPQKTGAPLVESTPPSSSNAASAARAEKGSPPKAEAISVKQPSRHDGEAIRPSGANAVAGTGAGKYSNADSNAGPTTGAEKKSDGGDAPNVGGTENFEGSADAAPDAGSRKKLDGRGASSRTRPRAQPPSALAKKEKEQNAVRGASEKDEEGESTKKPKKVEKVRKASTEPENPMPVKARRRNLEGEQRTERGWECKDCLEALPSQKLMRIHRRTCERVTMNKGARAKKSSDEATVAQKPGNPDTADTTSLLELLPDSGAVEQKSSQKDKEPPAGSDDESSKSSNESDSSSDSGSSSKSDKVVDKPKAPAKLPAGWVEQWSEEYEIAFFYNADTGTSVWERPTE